MVDEPDSLRCPACDADFEPQPGTVQQCPACGEQFFATQSADETDEDRDAQLALEQRLQDQSQTLDNRHIRFVQLEKRSLYRWRTWMLVIALGCVGLAGQLVWIGVRQWTSDSTRSIAYFVVAVGVGVFSLRFFARAQRYLKQAQTMSLAEPTTPPDFSTLSDGSQIVDQLRSMSRHDD